jgi:multidrug efflux system membrane fusion protein
MKHGLQPRCAWAAPDRRVSSTMGRSLTYVLILVALVGCSERSGHGGSDSQDHAKEPAAVSQPKSPGTVELKEDVQRALHLTIVPLSAASAAPTIPAYGRVLDPAPLASAVSEWAAARAASVASEQEFERVTTLRQQNTASVRALQAAEASAVRDRLLVESIRDRVALTWGRVLARRTDLTRLVQALTSQDRVIVRVELPVGEGPSALPQGARLTALSEPGKAIEAEFIGRAPATDPQLQGQGFLFLTRDNALNLTPGAAVSASLEIGGEVLRGVRLPDLALVRHDTQIWVYVQKDPTTFTRTRVALGPALPGGWLITQKLRASDRVVTQGAQVLLSEELKPQTSLPD